MRKNLLFLVGSLIASLLSFMLPYYLSPTGSYVPKSVPGLGYVVPKTPFGWFFVVLGLFFLAVAFVNARKLKHKS